MLLKSEIVSPIKFSRLVVQLRVGKLYEFNISEHEEGQDLYNFLVEALNHKHTNEESVELESSKGIVAINPKEISHISLEKKSVDVSSVL